NGLLENSVFIHLSPPPNPLNNNCLGSSDKKKAKSLVKGELAKLTFNW
ncbi:14041_t:CDS:2, partial [Funneliformis geosporum]